MCTYKKTGFMVLLALCMLFSASSTHAAAPVITLGASTSVDMSEDGSPIGFGLTLNATDVDDLVGDTLTWSISIAATSGEAIASGTGLSKAISYAPLANFNGSANFTVQVFDGTDADSIEVTVNLSAQNDLPTGTVSIDNTTPAEGDTLSVSHNLADVDGLGAISYEWFRGATSLGTGATYTVVATDIGSSLFVTASYTDGQDSAESVDSASTSLVSDNVNVEPTGSVSISDTTPEEDQILIASNSLADDDGLGAISYEWRTGLTVLGSGANYTVLQSDVDNTITVTASYTDDLGSAESVTSAETSAVVNVNDDPTGTVSIDNTTPAEGDTLSVSHNLTDADGLGTINYQWQRDSGNISGATGSAYNTIQLDVGKAMTVVASYTDGGGMAEIVSSAATAPVINVDNPPTGEVSISGIPTEDQTLTASNNLEDTDGLGAISYRWRRGGVNISDATNTTYILGDLDVGTMITVVASYTDLQGKSESEISDGVGPIVNINDAPTISGAAGTLVAEDTAYSFTPTASDVDVGDSLSFSINIAPSWASFSTTTGALTGTPSNSDVGITNGIVITVTDSFSASTSLPAFNLEVSNTNNAPTISGAPAISVAEDSPYSFTPTASDVDVGDTLVFSINITPGWASFSTSTGVLTGTPVNADVGTSNGIIITVTDSSSAFASLPAFNLQVSNTNDIPIISSTEATTAIEDEAYSYTITATDEDVGDTLTLSAPVLPAWLSFNATTGALSGTPTNSDVGGNPVTLRVNDGTVNVDQGFSITVANVNDAPTISGSPGTLVAEGNPYSFTATANDIDVGDSLSFSINIAPSWASFSTVTGALTGTPSNSDAGTTNGIVITVTDSFSASTSLPAFNLEVSNTNNAPTISGTPGTSVAEDSSYSFTPSAADADIGDTLVFSIANAPGWSVFDPATGALSGTPTNSEVGITSGIVITVTDGSSASVSLPAFNLQVININDLPTISGIPGTLVAEGSPYSFTPSALDVDVGDTLIFSIANTPGWAEFDPATGTLSGTPINSDVGVTNGIVITVTDSSLASASLPVFNLQVSNTNNAPTISGTPGTSVAEDSSYSFTPSAADADIGDTLVFSIANAPGWSVFDPATGALSGTPTNSEVGITSGIVITVTDGSSASVSLPAFNLQVININDLPTITSTAVTTASEDIAYSYTFTATDVDVVDTLTYSTPLLPVWLSFDVATGVLSGIPTNVEVGSHAITLQVNDGTVSINQNFSITVGNANDAPVITGIPVTRVVEGLPYSFLPSADDEDSNDNLTFAIINSPVWASFNTLNGELSGTPSATNVGVTSGVVIGVNDGTATVNLPAFDLVVVGDLDKDTIGDDVDDDIDGDGMPNDFEASNNLNLRDATDATLDADNDGVSNLNEYLTGTDPVKDETPPIVIAPADVTLVATGLFTAVTYEEATAIDFVDGARPVTRDLDNHLPPGANVVTWSATDLTGNVGTDTQVINIIPLVEFSINQVAAEGNVVDVKVTLNGLAVNYPVVVPYTVSGSAVGGDHDLVDGIITINSGAEAELSFNIINDGTGDGGESIIITMGTPTNAEPGSSTDHVIQVVEGNVAPRVVLQASQGSGVTRVINQADPSPVIVVAYVTDPNNGDTHFYDWSGSDNALVDTDAVANTFSFVPPANPGIYTLRSVVSDGLERDEIDLVLNIVASAPVLTSADSDGDGIDDVTEGYGDADDDGVPDYLDAIFVANVLQAQSGASQYLMETESGLGLALGMIAFQANPGQAVVSSADIVNYSNSQQDILPNVGGLFDFVVSGLPEVGQSVRVVLPQSAPIPAFASFRKLMPAGWQDFVEDGRNAVSSAAGEAGYCPPPSDIAYTSGLIEGNWCVQLLIEDGGPNDADLSFNRRVVDPGGLVQLRSIKAEVTSSGGAIYSMLLLLMLWQLWIRFQVRKI